MWQILSTILGTGDVVSKGMKLIDDMHYSDAEEAADRLKMVEAKTKAKTELMSAYAPFKLAQRYIALSFTFVFIFILMNGVLGALYGWVPMENVDKARTFADDMWLGQIMLTIIAWYFGGGVLDSVKAKK